jgi:hypothetical protein
MRNPIEALPGLIGLAKGHSPRIQEEPQRVPSQPKELFQI